MKASGDQTATPYLKNMVKTLGVPEAEVSSYIGENPSYFAQMELLTSKLYQNPAFGTNLYTSPENVKRIGVTLQAIKVMQDRDRYEASLRREMLASLILEMKLRKRQEALNNRLVGIFAGNPGQ
jgi:hypothetical protein